MGIFWRGRESRIFHVTYKSIWAEVYTVCDIWETEIKKSFKVFDWLQVLGQQMSSSVCKLNDTKILWK